MALPVILIVPGKVNRDRATDLAEGLISYPGFAAETVMFPAVVKPVRVRVYSPVSAPEAKVSFCTPVEPLIVISSLDSPVIDLSNSGSG
jgi:hypothetical protein